MKNSFPAMQLPHPKLFLAVIVPLLVVTISAIAVVGQVNGVAYQDEPFWQETHEAFPFSTNVRSISCDHQSNIWIATETGVFVKRANLTRWESIMGSSDNGPAYSVTIDSQKNIWVGTWKGVYRFVDNQLQHQKGIDTPVSVLCAAKEGMYAIGPNGIWLFDGQNFVKKNYEIPRSVRDAVSDGQGGLWLASDVGLYYINKEGKTRILRDPNEVQSAYIKGITIAPNQQLWAGGLGG